MTIVIAAVFVVVAAIIVGAYALFIARPEAADAARLRQRLRAGAAPAEAEAGVVQRTLPTRPQIEQMLSRGGLTAPLELLLERAGTKTSLSTVLGLCLAAGVAGAVIMARLSPRPVLGLFIGLAAGWLPIAFMRAQARRRLAKFEEQFPEAIELIARALRAGHAFTTGLALASEEMPDPVGNEFRLVYDRQNFGMPIADALQTFAERVPLLDARFFVTAVLTQRESGGNLAEILDNLGSVIRQRFRVRRQIRVVTAHARLTGWVLSLMPVAIALAMLFVAPDHIGTLFTDPLGIQMMFAAGCLWGIGVLIIRRLIRVEY